MKKFILRLFLFITPIIIISLIVEFSLRAIPNSYKVKADYLKKHSNEIKILILGSSHASMGLNPYLINGVCYNAAMTSQSIDIDLEILKKHKGQWHNLKFIVLPIDYFSLYSRLESSTESWRIKDYVISYNLPLKSTINNHYEIFSSSLIKIIKRLYNYYFLQNSELYYTELGNEDFGIKKNEYELIISGKNAAKRHTKVSSSYFSKNLDVLKQFKNFCINNNVNLILYTSPGYKSYTFFLDSTQLNTTINTIKSFSYKKPFCIYKNFLTDSSFYKSDFYDGDHLNDKGSKKLSLKINDIIINWKLKRRTYEKLLSY